MANHAAFIDLVEKIYDAAAEPTRWSSTLAQVGDYLNAEGGLLIGFSWAQEEVGLRADTINDAHFIEMYRQKYVRNPWADLAILQPTGHGFTTEALIELKELERTEYFQEHLRPQDIVHGATACLAGNSDFLAGVTIHRGARRGAFEASEMERFQAIVPHLQRAVQLQLRAEGWAVLRAGAQHALDQLSLGIILLGAGGSVLFCNEAAARTCELRDGLVLENAQIRIADSAAAARLKRLIGGARNPGLEAQFGGSTVTVPRANHLPLQLLVTPLVGNARTICRDATVAIFIRDPERVVAPKPKWLIDLYGLTPMEAQVAIAIATGIGAPQAAVELGIGVNTVKTHLGKIFVKTGTRNQVQLALLIRELAF